MCGIFGMIKDRLPDRDVLISMRDAMWHRGPDDAGLWISPDGQVCLSQRRLAVIDLSSDGHQPMADTSGHLQITFNGEIYNYLELHRELELKGHQFRTVSDTEVILESYLEWGKDFVSHLNGMFSFALYDLRKKELLIVRDRAGEKPLYYRVGDGELWFASELKAFTANPTFSRQIDPDALDRYFTFGYIPGDYCIFSGVKKLPPAHILTYSLESRDFKLERYWNIPVYDKSYDFVSDTELLIQFEDLLEDSVRRQLIADVPVGILLSGGIDSSLIAAVAMRASKRPVKTFTISFPGHIVEDESGYARLVAEYLGTEHTELAAEPASIDLLPQLARQFDEPMADSSMIPTYIVSKLIREFATVAIGGDGGDELFAGYQGYSEIQKDVELLRMFPRFIRMPVAWTASRFMPVGMKGRHRLMGLGGDLSNAIIYYNVMFDPETRTRLAPALGSATSDVFDCKSSFIDKSCSPLNQFTRMDFQTRMVDDYLVKVDRASMFASLEARAPFLDYRLVEFAFSKVPDRLRATKTDRKILPKMLAKRLLPPSLDLNRKQGFSIPLDAWLRNEWFDFSYSVLSEADQSIFDRKFILDLLSSLHRRGVSNKWRIFTVLLFELWRREYKAYL